MSRMTEIWPLYGLRLSVGDLELRYPDEKDMADVAELLREPVHDPEVMPFSVPFTDAPEPERVRGALQFHWRARAEWSADNWGLPLVVVRDGEVVGTQQVNGKAFVVLREVETGSWLGRRHQGRGAGTLMRRAVLHLAFAGLGASAARSGAFYDNAASLRVSEKLGYVPDGTETLLRRGEPARMVRLILTRQRWEEADSQGPPVTISGLESCLEMFGLESR
jgi:RimJ/RimL family protein N-acetyltransferase